MEHHVGRLFFFLLYLKLEFKTSKGNIDGVGMAPNTKEQKNKFTRVDRNLLTLQLFLPFQVSKHQQALLIKHPATINDYVYCKPEQNTVNTYCHQGDY